MAKKLRAATPADAKAVYDSIIKTGGKPTVRGIATALNQCGKFHTIHFSVIQRWKKNSWATRKKKGLRQPALVEAAAKLDMAVPTITGDPTTRLKDILDHEDNKEIVAALRDLPTDQLMDRALRENAIAAIVVALEIQKNPKMAAEMPREAGSLLVALSGSMTPTVSGFDKLRQIEAKTIEGTAVPIADNGKASPLSSVWAEFEKASEAAG